jgi:hypothetical protein
MPLTAEEVRRRADRAVASFDDNYHRPDGNLERWSDEDVATIVGEIRGLLEAYPHLVDTFDYGWTVDPTAYRIPFDAIFQAYVLRLIADVDQSHPRLRGHTPIAARVAINRDFVSHSLPRPEVQFVFVSRGYMDYLKYFLELALSLVKLEGQLEDPGRPASWWGVADIGALTRAFPEKVNDALRTFTLEATDLMMERLLEHGIPIGPELSKSKSLLSISYDSAETFLVAHEVGHLLEQHQRGRTLDQEIFADRTALSLALASSGTEKREALKRAWAVPFLGAPLVLRTSRWFFELNRTMEWLLGKKQRQNYDAVLAELEARWAWCQLAFVDFGLPLKGLREITAEIEAVAGLADLFLTAMKEQHTPHPSVES